MTIDKFLTDLASCTGCETVTVEYRDFCGASTKFNVSLFRKDGTQPHGWLLRQGEGPTVEAAMAEARAKLTAHYQVAAA